TSASTKADDALKTIGKAAEEQTKKKGGFGRKLGWVLVGTAVAGAGVVLWRRSQPVDDPWAEEYWDDVPAAVSPTVAEKLNDAAGKVQEVTEEAKDKAEDAVDAAKHKAEDVADAAKDKGEDVVDTAQDAAK